MFEFCNNEERRYLMIFSSNVPGEGLIASFKAPHNIAEKAMFFCKTNQVNKLSRDNIANDVGFCDCSRKPLKHLKRLVKDVYLPVLSIEHGGSVSADKLMDLLHRVVANLHVFDGNNQVSISFFGGRTLHGPSRLVCAYSCCCFCSREQRKKGAYFGW
jgi:hypothetical protein